MESDELTFQLKKSPILAAFMSFLQPAVGFLYVGQLNRGLLFLVISLLFDGVMYCTFRYWENPNPFMLSLGAVLLGTFAFQIFVAVQAFKEAKKLNKKKKYPKLWYSNFFFVIGVYLLLSYVSEQFVREYEKMGMQYSVNGESMQPTLIEGDFIFLDKRPESLTNLKDKIVLYEVREFGKKKQHLGLVVASGGQRIQYKDGVIQVNGIRLKLSYVKEAKIKDSELFAASSWDFKKQFGESQEFVVPRGSYFILPTSFPSKAGSHVFGPVIEKNILALARFVSVSLDPKEGKIRFDRTGKEL